MRVYQHGYQRLQPCTGEGVRGRVYQHGHQRLQPCTCKGGRGGGRVCVRVGGRVCEGISTWLPKITTLVRV